MKTEIKFVKGVSHGPEVYNNVWEIQDNENEYFVIKFHDHGCVKLKKEDVAEINVSVDYRG